MKGSVPPVEVTELRKLRREVAQLRHRLRWGLLTVLLGWFLGNAAGQVLVRLLFGP